RCRCRIRLSALEVRLPALDLLGRAGTICASMVDMRRRGANAVALVFGCLSAAGAAELAVTLGLGEQVKFPRHVVAAPWGLRFNEPGAVYRHKSADVEVWFRIDQQGMRDDRDFAYAKPPGVKRIVSLGDSFKIGYEVAPGEPS